MSYDLMIFDSETAPLDKDEFIVWAETQELEIGADLNNDSPKITSPKLKKWFHDAAKVVIPLSGPFSSENDDDYEEGQDDERGAEYYIGKKAIFVMFATVDVDELTRKLFALADKHQVGIYAFSSADAP